MGSAECSKVAGDAADFSSVLLITFIKKEQMLMDPTQSCQTCRT